MQYAKILIEGHCDERGTEEYNLALGKSGPRAALDYLLSLGIPADRMKIHLLRQKPAARHGQRRDRLVQKPPGPVPGHREITPSDAVARSGSCLSSAWRSLAVRPRTGARRLMS